MNQVSLLDIYVAPAIRVETPSILRGSYFNHLGFAVGRIYSDDENKVILPNVTIHILAEEHQDHRRFGRVGVVYATTKTSPHQALPIFMFQNAGREGDDHVMCYYHDVALLETFMRETYETLKPTLNEEERLDFVSEESYYENLHKVVQPSPKAGTSPEEKAALAAYEALLERFTADRSEFVFVENTHTPNRSYLAFYDYYLTLSPLQIPSPFQIASGRTAVEIF